MVTGRAPPGEFGVPAGCAGISSTSSTPKPRSDLRTPQDRSKPPERVINKSNMIVSHRGISPDNPVCSKDFRVNKR